MEFEASLVTTGIILLLCLILSLLTTTFCLFYCLLSNRVKNVKASLSPTLAINDIESGFAKGQSIDLPDVTIDDSDVEALSTIATSIRTPFGTRTSPLDLASSLRASWMSLGHSQGHDTLAAALEGVLTLYLHLGELQLQRNSIELASTDPGIHM